MTLEKCIKQKIFRGKKSRSGKTFHEKQLVGYLVAGIDEDNQVGMGFSLLHKNDRYDFIKGIRKPGFGETLAEDRAIKSAETGRVEVPPSLLKMMKKFHNRCERYYKGAIIPNIMTQVVAYETHQPRLFIQTHDRVRTVEEM